MGAPLGWIDVGRVWSVSGVFGFGFPCPSGFLMFHPKGVPNAGSEGSGPFGMGAVLEGGHIAVSHCHLKLFFFPWGV